jgi:hypothetical protein
MIDVRDRYSLLSLSLLTTSQLSYYNISNAVLFDKAYMVALIFTYLMIMWFQHVSSQPIHDASPWFIGLLCVSRCGDYSHRSVWVEWRMDKGLFWRHCKYNFYYPHSITLSKRIGAYVVYIYIHIIMHISFMLSMLLTYGLVV